MTLKGAQTIPMEKRELLYEGKAKQIYATDRDHHVWVKYKNDATAFNGKKRDEIIGKGELNNRISGIFFRFLEAKGIPTHYVKPLSPTEQLVRQVTIIPLEVVVRNIAAGSLSERIGWAEGTELPKAVVETYYKNDDLGDPLVNEMHIATLQLAAPEQVAQMKRMALDINFHLQQYLEQRNVLLVDFKLEFGLTSEDELLLADEISPDTCRFWDAITGEKLDKDRFRRDLGDVKEAYQEMLNRLGD